MSEMLHLLSGASLFLLAFSVLVLDIPRYTLTLVSVALFGVRRRKVVEANKASISVIIPTFNGGSGLNRSIASLHRQTLRPIEIIVVDDGSTDETRAVAEHTRALGLVDTVTAMEALRPERSYQRRGTICQRRSAAHGGR